MNQTLLNKVTESIFDETVPWSMTYKACERIAEKVLTDLGADDERHVANLTRDNFVLQHPIHERLLGSLLDCDLHARVADETFDVTPLGEYYVSIDENDDIQFVKKED